MAAQRVHFALVLILPAIRSITKRLGNSKTLLTFIKSKMGTRHCRHELGQCPNSNSSKNIVVIRDYLKRYLNPLCHVQIAPYYQLAAREYYCDKHKRRAMLSIRTQSSIREKSIRRLLKLGLCTSLMAAGGFSHAEKVVGIISGDTLMILENQRPVEIRLAYIDAPESGQPFGKESQASLTELCLGKGATYEKQSTDSSGRVTALVLCDGSEANRAQIKRGMAWVDPRSNPDVSLPFLQEWIFVEKRGLWADPNPVPPWEWHKQQLSSK